jgi:dephospho-CoA kinase
MAAPTVGLTGGIASGKSTVARLFEKLGIPVVDADAIARQVVRKGTEGLREIVEAFGEGVLDDEGELDRSRLANIVFDDDDARRRLNAITHPRIAETSAEQIAALAQGGPPYIIYEAALLVENGSHRAFSALVVVAADEATQLARMEARDGLSEADARARLEAQLPVAKKVEVADFVIYNNGTREEAEAQTRAVHRSLLERFAQ